MEHALAVVGPEDVAKDLVREAGELAAGVDARLTLLCVVSEDEYADEREALEAIPEADVSYSVDQALEGARSFASDVGVEALDGVDIEYETAGAVGDRAETVLQGAKKHGCDHVFLTGQRRSPTGKAIFGDVTQRVILDFEGPVTVVTE
ncbi:universal stress protein [Halolamina litorea]|uniref:Universal stress protein n=1 Tax=Halolamina litorea TaxID=1515593 RepID=A0ABD6BU87_9EURY|nr:universal stress protein [Halolamina litorea]